MSGTGQAADDSDLAVESPARSQPNLDVPIAPKSEGLSRSLLTGLLVYAGSSILVLLGGVFGSDFVGRSLDDSRPRDPIESLARFDAIHYRSIINRGYTYDPSRQSEVAFFPVYPLLARGLMWVTGWPDLMCLLLVANVNTALACVLLRIYIRDRLPDSPAFADVVLLTFALTPATFFFRMAYTESTLVALTLLFMLGVQRRWPAVLVALFAGAATAARPVGVALLPVLWIYLWRTTTSRRRFVGLTVILTPLACSGLIAYSVFLWWSFGDPLAFAKTQHFWRTQPEVPWLDRLASLLIFEPIWGSYIPSSRFYYRHFESHDNPFFSLLAVNVLYFVATVALVVFGALRRWLTVGEVVLSAGFLLIPYLTRGYDNSMLAFARFSAVVVPAYLVLGRLVAALPSPIPGLVTALAGFFLAAYTALFAAGFWLF